MDASARYTRYIAALTMAFILPWSVMGGTASAEQSSPDAPISMSSDGQQMSAPVPQMSQASVGEFAGSAGTGDLDDVEGYVVGRTPDPDALAAGGGQFSEESVIGDDDRIRSDGTDRIPQSAIVLITSKNPQGESRRCTGWLYGESTVATAGHCVYTHDSDEEVDGWNTDFEIYPGRNAGESPYGSCGWNRAWTVNGWIQDGKAGYDYGAIVLDCNIGEATGWFGMRWQAASYNGTGVTIEGYPSDKSPKYSMWWDGGLIEESGLRDLEYEMDTYHGQSGAPVYADGCTTYCGVAIHAYGTGLLKSNNSGTRITESAFHNYANWRS